MTIINQTARGHRQIIQHCNSTGQWWVNCHCPGRPYSGIVFRQRHTAGSSFCQTQQQALETAAWHARGERGPAPGTVTQLDLFDTTGGAP